MEAAWRPGAAATALLFGHPLVTVHLQAQELLFPL